MNGLGYADFPLDSVCTTVFLPLPSISEICPFARCWLSSAGDDFFWFRFFFKSGCLVKSMILHFQNSCLIIFQCLNFWLNFSSMFLHFFFPSKVLITSLTPVTSVSALWTDMLVCLFCVATACAARGLFVAHQAGAWVPFDTTLVWSPDPLVNQIVWWGWAKLADRSISDAHTLFLNSCSWFAALFPWGRLSLASVIFSLCHTSRVTQSLAHSCSGRGDDSVSPVSQI